MVMIKTREQLEVKTESNVSGDVKLFLSNLADFEGKNPKLRMFAHASLKPGEEVEFHIHNGESESYYILSGTGDYDDNGTHMIVNPGTVTFTPSGSGHGIKNIGREMLEFIALIILD
jgi:mannose-6-phosphate isomerase-like protein (cupin superfamily)